MTRDDVFNNVTLYLVTVPQGAGGAFLGYLQRVYMGFKPPLAESQFPKLNRWDDVRGAWVDIHQVFDNDYDRFFPFKLDALIGPRASVKEKNNLSKKYNDAFTLWWDHISGRNYETHDGINKFIPPELIDIDENMMNPLADFIATQQIPRTLAGNLGYFFVQHEYLYGINKYFKKVEHLLTIECDLESHIYCNKLKRIKTGIHRLVEGRPECHFDNQARSNKEFPAKININYNKFFFEQDMNEIEKFLVGTLPINDVNQERLDPIVDMIKTYTKLNKELLNE
jgi:hypothetical protein